MPPANADQTPEWSGQKPKLLGTSPRVSKNNVIRCWAKPIFRYVNYVSSQIATPGFKCCSKCPCLLRQYLYGIHHSNGIPIGKCNRQHLLTSYCCLSKNRWSLSQRSRPTLPAHPAGPNPRHPGNSDHWSRLYSMAQVKNRQHSKGIELNISWVSKLKPIHDLYTTRLFGHVIGLENANPGKLVR